MTSSILRRPVQGLMAGCALLLGVVLLPGCPPSEKAEKAEKAAKAEKAGAVLEALAHRPPLVLLVDKKNVTDGKAKADIDVAVIKFGDFSMPDLLKEAQDWRLLVYKLNGAYVEGDGAFGTKTKFQFTKLPVEKMLRVHLDVHPKGASPKDMAETKSFAALVHVFPDDNPPTLGSKR